MLLSHKSEKNKFSPDSRENKEDERRRLLNEIVRRIELETVKYFQNKYSMIPPNQQNHVNESAGKVSDMTRLQFSEIIDELSLKFKGKKVPTSLEKFRNREIISEPQRGEPNHDQMFQRLEPKVQQEKEINKKVNNNKTNSYEQNSSRNGFKRSSYLKDDEIDDENKNLTKFREIRERIKQNEENEIENSPIELNFNRKYKANHKTNQNNLFQKENQKNESSKKEADYQYINQQSEKKIRDNEDQLDGVKTHLNNENKLHTSGVESSVSQSINKSRNQIDQDNNISTELVFNRKFGSVKKTQEESALNSEIEQKSIIKENLNEKNNKEKEEENQIESIELVLNRKFKPAENNQDINIKENKDEVTKEIKENCDSIELVFNRKLKSKR